MQEKRGVAHCASTFASDGCPPAAVYAAPVFVPVTMDTDDLPLQELYDHPDFVDIISAREFGLERPPMTGCCSAWWYPRRKARCGSWRS